MTSRLPKICVAIQAATPADVFSRAALALKDARFLEFRLDSLPSPSSALPRLQKFLAEHNVTAIATCRRKPNSGSFTGSLDEELSILLKAARAGCQLVDLEIESAEEALPAQLEKFRAALGKIGAQLIVSFHDFSRTHAIDRAALFDDVDPRVVARRGGDVERAR